MKEGGLAGGYTGNLLYVDLTKQESTIRPLDETYARKFIGGSGLACRILYDMVDMDTDPLSPANPLILMTGPLTGTSAPSSSKYSICSKSPLTGIWGESSVGGFFGPRLKWAGFDGVVITGRSPMYGYLFIHDGTVEFHDASHLEERTTFETQEIVKKEVGGRGTSVASIGQAGENMVKYASVLNDGGKAAGRTGMGAVMGSKRLKAVAVQGSGRVAVAEEEKFAAAADEARSYLLESFTTEMYRALGTGGYVDYAQDLGAMPNRYFTQGYFEGAHKISGSVIADSIKVGNDGCYACPIAHKQIIRVDSGKYRLPETDGPEYETLAALGSNLLIDDLEGISYANYLCNAYGVDTISSGMTIGFAYLLHERGIIPESVAPALNLGWGDVDTAIELIRMIAHREGLGDTLAEGVRHMGERYGAEDLASHVKGLEVSAQDPRAFFGMTMCYATSPRGACHMQGDMYSVDLGIEFPELGIVSTDRHSDERKAEIAIKCQNLRALYNSLVMCQFANLEVRSICDLLSYATGLKVGVDGIDATGERIFNLKRAFNNRMGTRREDDTIPKLILTPLSDGGTQGRIPDFERQMREYYELRGWDWSTGKPSRERLEELGLAEISDTL